MGWIKDSLWWGTVFIYIQVKWIQMHSIFKKLTEQQTFMGQTDRWTQRTLANIWTTAVCCSLCPASTAGWSPGLTMGRVGGGEMAFKMDEKEWQVLWQWEGWRITKEALTLKNRVNLNLTCWIACLVKRRSADIFREKEIEVHKIDVKVYCQRKKIWKIKIEAWNYSELRKETSWSFS